MVHHQVGVSHMSAVAWWIHTKRCVLMCRHTEGILVRTWDIASHVIRTVNTFRIWGGTTPACCTQMCANQPCGVWPVGSSINNVLDRKAQVSNSQKTRKAKQNIYMAGLAPRLYAPTVTNVIHGALCLIDGSWCLSFCHLAAKALNSAPYRWGISQSMVWTGNKTLYCWKHIIAQRSENDDKEYKHKFHCWSLTYLGLIDIIPWQSLWCDPRCPRTEVGWKGSKSNFFPCF